MCGLFGLVAYKTTIKGEQVKSKLVKQLGVEAQVRGTDATGISYNEKYGHAIFKKDIAAKDFQFNIPTSTKVIMGHTRKTTQGTERDNYNNHPFLGHIDEKRVFSLAHNGVLDNDYQLKSDEHLPETKIKTDSYVMVQLIEKHLAEKQSFQDAIKQAAEKVSGMFTFTILDQSNNLYFVKNDSPMHIVHIPQLGMYAYASTESIVNNAIKSVGIQKYKQEIIKIKPGDILQIKPTGEIARSTFIVNTRFVDYSNPWYRVAGGYDDYNYIEEQLFQEGLYTHEIELMFDYYTNDEIEDFLWDGTTFDMLFEALRQDKYNQVEKSYSSLLAHNM